MADEKPPSRRGKHSASFTRENARELGAKGGRKSRRVGVPDGMKRKQADGFHAHALAEAKEIMKIMIDQEMIPVPTTTDEQKANEALEYSVAVVRDPAVGPRERLQAARTVLEYTKQKPTQKVDTTVRAEDFLEALLNK